MKAGERLLSIEAMKMETAVYSPRDATVGEVLVAPGTVVEARDLLVILKTSVKSNGLRAESDRVRLVD